MRTAFTLILLALVACLSIAGLVLLSGGRTFVYAPAVGMTSRLGTWLPWSWGAMAVGAGAALLAHAAARAFPRRYYQILWWRDLAMLACLLGTLATTVIYFARVLAYGSP